MLENLGLATRDVAVERAGAEPRSQQEAAILRLLRDVFARLDAAGIPHCVLRNRDRIPSGILAGSDVDLIVPAGSRAADLIRLLADLEPVHVTCHRATVEVYFEVEGTMLHLDLLIADREWRGACYLENQEILREAWCDDGIPVASKLHQAFCAWFSSLTRMRKFKPRYAPLIYEVVDREPARLKELLHRAFGLGLGGELFELARQRRLDACERLAGRCRRAIWLRAFWRRPWGTLTGCCWHYLAEVARLLRPPGLTVAILGPDGAGKSAVCGRLASLPRGRLPFRRVEARHMYRRVLPLLTELKRGRIRRSRAVPVTVHDPHGKRPHPVPVSLISVGYAFIDQWLSHVGPGRRELVRNTLVLHDRHMRELALDPRRFRYGGPDWLARLLARLMPRPGLLILLDGPAEILHERKREVPLAETERQRNAYHAYVSGFPNGRIIDATQPLEAVADEVRAAILDFMRLRTARELRLQGAS